jgi:GDP-4-dehydro-6-deoxy-D-mannose reductase
MLITGANGFLGGHLLAVGHEAGLRVVPGSRGGEEGAPPCDLLDPAGVEACIEAVRPDLIVNAAGAASVGRSWEDPAQTFATNATGVLNLLEAVASKAPEAHVLCISSADVYGLRSEEELPLGEELEPRPVTPYGASKAAMEIVCGQFARARGLHVAVARAFNLVGPGQSPQFAVSGFARRIAAAEGAGESVELALGNADAVRDFVDVREGAAALLEVSRQRLSGTYNLCSGRGTTMAELVAALAAEARVPVTWRHDPGLARPADPPALLGDPTRLRLATGFAAETPLSDSLADLLGEWRARPASA